MDFIDGVTLNDDMWEGITPEAKTKIYDKLGEQLRLLRSIPPPHPSFYGRVNNQGYHPFGMVVGHGKHVAGPFHTYRAFLEYAITTLEYRLVDRCVNKPIGCSGKIDPIVQLLASNFFQNLEDTSGSGEPKFSHMDIKLDNIMLVPSASNPSDRIEDHDLWLIDWEYSCWLPAWAEAAGCLRRLPGSDTEERLLPQWRMSREGIKPFYWGQAGFWMSCCGYLGGTL
ncbi:hypothetical protein K491DRAFT_515092 [Lophiostoma macrostomum CBS 122681]|uniref:Aminoglycoside phosphotransferase domain-containing protein n=1 Tax=Lophiostoma macrostomum CBS 122681 TaxID=1314788 RepID=A0A6A6T2H8_9PLEO|nr:hypothetical protein K491DRAFT_515092 [Lophiostoma macrostomum CBS 122681]